jgi:DNA-binding NarL/FixJ family response regulator
VGTMRVLLLDPDEVWRRGFRRLVEETAGWEICGETADPDTAERMAPELAPDVVAVDGSCPPETMQAIVRGSPETGVLVFGSPSRHEEGAPRRLLAAGAKGLVSKSESAQILREALETVARNRAFLSPVASDWLLRSYLSGPRADKGGTRPEPALTPREREVVRLLADAKSSREIALTLGISVKTVENHRANAMRKLGARSIGDLVRIAIRSRWIEP